MLTHAGQRAFYPLSPAHILNMSAAGWARQSGAKTRAATAAHAAHFRTAKVAALQKNL
jgi:hypothetical protein